MLLNLQEFNKSHIPLTFEWVKEKEFQRLFLIRGEVTWEKHFAYFDAILNDSQQRVYAILYDGYHIGNCGFKNIREQDGIGELWIYIGKDSLRGRGLGTQAARLLIQQGFNNLSLNRIYLHVADFNLFARKMYKNLGFIEVTMEEKNEEWDGRGYEIIHMELNRE